jgi:hypothetical protein
MVLVVYFLVASFPENENLSQNCHQNCSNPFCSILVGLFVANFLEVYILKGYPFVRPASIESLPPAQVGLFVDQRKKYFVTEGGVTWQVVEPLV